MNGERRPLGLIDHAVGAVCATVVLSFGAQIATTASNAVSRCLSLLDNGASLSFVYVEGHAPWWVALAGVGFLGALVVGFDALVRSGRLRPWVPPLTMLVLSCAALTVLLSRDGAGWAVGAIMGGGAGMAIGLAFSAWWFASRVTARLRTPRRSRASGRSGPEDNAPA